MEIVSLSITNYRSITRAKKLEIGRSTVLVGPNNEGKSNILKALVTALRVLTHGRRFPGQARTLTTDSLFSARNLYNWETDFPIGLQEKKPDGKTVFLVEFQLTEDEIVDFKKDIKSNLNGTLPLKIEIGQHSCKVTVNKRGPGGTALTDKSVKIAAFVSERVDFDYVPAVRTAESAQQVVESLVERELRTIEHDPAYKQALDTIAKIQEPILEKLSSAIKNTLVEFLPDIKDVSVQIEERSRYRSLRRISQIVVDDGDPTSLNTKGDGAQSLAALGITRHASDRGARGRNLLVAIEEPESHLHPSAIHALRNVIYELAEKHQVVLTTHNPLFVDKQKVAANIIVKDGKATPAKSISQIRETLGVRASDNLRHAQLILLVEGEEDRKMLRAILPARNAEIRQAMADGTIAIDSLGGGTNLSYKASLVRDSICDCHCFLDDDKCGHESFEKARTQGILRDSDVQFTIMRGKDESEFEDLLLPSLYEKMLLNTYRVSIQHRDFKGKGKWSDRLKRVFEQQGKRWSDRIEMDVKITLLNWLWQTRRTQLSRKRQAAWMHSIKHCLIDLHRLASRDGERKFSCQGFGLETMSTR